MRTVKEVSKMTGVSVRTLHYYDRIGLLPPSDITRAGYRMYDDVALERLQHILLFRELEFSLKEIKAILESSDFDRNRALEQQIELLMLKKEHIENLITFARGIKGVGVRSVDFSAFDTRKMDEYAAQAKAIWGKTDSFKEFEEKTGKKSKEEMDVIWRDMMTLFVEFGKMSGQNPGSKAAQEQVIKLRNFITENFYRCDEKILSCLGKMYDGGGSMTENIDRVGGKGTARFAAEAIAVYCSDGEHPVHEERFADKDEIASD